MAVLVCGSSESDSCITFKIIFKILDIAHEQQECILVLHLQCCMKTVSTKQYALIIHETISASISRVVFFKHMQIERADKVPWHVYTNSVIYLRCEGPSQ